MHAVELAQTPPRPGVDWGVTDLTLRPPERRTMVSRTRPQRRSRLTLATATKHATLRELSCRGISAMYSMSSFAGPPWLSCEGLEGELAFFASEIETPSTAIALRGVTNSVDF
jgi:hypothetical protein